MDYQQARKLMQDLARFGVNPGLCRIEELLCRLSNPEQRIRKYAHIAGTNGKGSVAAMLNSISIQAGKKVGLFTSPHLHNHRERYRINNISISKDNFAHIADMIFPEIAKMLADGHESPTEFEVATVISLMLFAYEDVDVAVMEVGMGGNIDSTNVCPSQLAVITNVDFDHMDYLGHSILEIARVKAGIIKQNATVITGAKGVALDVIAEKAHEQNARLLVFDHDIKVSIIEMRASGSIFHLNLPKVTWANIFIPLLGEHQIENAALAIAAAAELGFSEEEIRLGLMNVCWPGRLEIFRKEPLIVMDGAHNAAGMRSLARAVELYWSQKRILCILGMLSDKDWEQALSPLLPWLKNAIITPPPMPGRINGWQDLAKIFKGSNIENEVIASNEQACAKALSLLSSEKFDMLLVCGSLYLLSEVRKILLDRHDIVEE